MLPRDGQGSLKLAVLSKLPRLFDGGEFEWRTIERTSHLDGVMDGGETRRQLEDKTVATTAETRLREVVAVDVRQHRSEQLATGKDVQAHRRFRMILTLGPAGNAVRADEIDTAAELADGVGFFPGSAQFARVNANRAHNRNSCFPTRYY